MYKSFFSILMMLLLLQGFTCTAQLRAVITDLNNKKEHELKIGDTFYFGLSGQQQKVKGTLEAVNMHELQISGKTYACKDITWIDSKGRSPKKNATEVSKILLYFGGGLASFASFRVAADNTNKEAITGTVIGGGLMAAALCFKVFARQPQFDFSTRFLLETLTPVVDPDK